MSHSASGTKWNRTIDAEATLASRSTNWATVPYCGEGGYRTRIIRFSVCCMNLHCYFTNYIVGLSRFELETHGLQPCGIPIVPTVPLLVITLARVSVDNDTIIHLFWRLPRGSNPQSPEWQSGMLPTTPRNQIWQISYRIIGLVKVNSFHLSHLAVAPLHPIHGLWLKRFLWDKCHTSLYTP